MSDTPNVLWICTDQQRADTIGCYGNDWVETPNIDRIASEGALFENCYVQSPICAPSRASFLTGRYPRTTRLRENGQVLPHDEKPYTRFLADAGYMCGLVGKYHMGPGDPAVLDTTEPRINDGLAEFRWSQAPGNQWGMNSDYSVFLAEKGLEFALPEHGLSRWIYHGMPEGCSEVEWTSHRTQDFIRRHAGGRRPWSYTVNMFAPHHPFNPPDRFLERYLPRLDEVPLPVARDDDLSGKSRYQIGDSRGAYGGGWGFGRDEMTDTDHRAVKAAYWAMCDHIDVEVGNILGTLEETGQADNTIVIYMSDHGEMLGDHNIYLKGPYFYDPEIRIPLIIWAPGRIAPARHARLFEPVNIVPTLMDACGVPQYAGFQGRSIWESLQSGTDTRSDSDSVYSEFYNAMPHYRDPYPYLTMLRTYSHKIVVDHSDDAGELYDLEADPLEIVNLWNDPDSLALRAEMLVKLTHRMAFTSDPLPERLAEW